MTAKGSGGDDLSDSATRRLTRLLDRHGEADYELDEATAWVKSSPVRSSS